MLDFFTSILKEWSPLELCAVIFTFSCIVCAVFEKIWTFPLGIIGTGLYFFVFMSQQAYSSMSLQLMFLLFNAYGLYKWTHPNEETAKSDNTLAITLLKINQRIWIGVLIIALMFILGFTTSNLHVWFPKVFAEEAFSHISTEYRSLCIYIDAFILSSSLVAQYLMAVKKLENWIIWLTVDCLSAPFYFITIGILTGFLYTAFIATGITGFITWRKSRKKYLLSLIK